MLVRYLVSDKNCHGWESTNYFNYNRCQWHILSIMEGIMIKKQKNSRQCLNFWKMSKLKGVPKKTSLKLRRSFCLISLATNMLEGWDIIHLKGEIHSFVSSTKSFLYDIRELRYKLNSIRFKKSWIMINPISLNLILRRFMYNFSSYEHCRGLRHVSF